MALMGLPFWFFQSYFGIDQKAIQLYCYSKETVLVKQELNKTQSQTMKIQKQISELAL